MGEKTGSKIGFQAVIFPVAVTLRALGISYQNALSENLGHKRLFSVKYKELLSQYDDVILTMENPKVQLIWKQSYNILNNEPFGELQPKLEFIRILEKNLIDMLDRADKLGSREEKDLIGDIFDSAFTRSDIIKDLK